MKNILITQRIVINKGDYDFILENNWNKIFMNSNIKLLTIKSNNLHKKKIDKLKPDGLILHGGNDLPELIYNKENKVRKQIDTSLFEYAIKKKIPILAVCYGFQLVAQYFGSPLIKKSSHVRKTHVLNLNLTYKKKFYKFLKVNSYHNYIIRNLPKKFNYICRHVDGSIELAISKKYKILCCMFHPERKSFDNEKQKKLVLSHLNTR